MSDTSSLQSTTAANRAASGGLVAFLAAAAGAAVTLVVLPCQCQLLPAEPARLVPPQSCGRQTWRPSAKRNNPSPACQACYHLRARSAQASFALPHSPRPRASANGLLPASARRGRQREDHLYTIALVDAPAATSSVFRSTQAFLLRYRFYIALEDHWRRQKRSAALDRGLSLGRVSDGRGIGSTPMPRSAARHVQLAELRDNGGPGRGLGRVCGCGGWSGGRGDLGSQQGDFFACRVLFVVGSCLARPRVTVVGGAACV